MDVEANVRVREEEEEKQRKLQMGKSRRKGLERFGRPGR